MKPYLLLTPGPLTTSETVKETMMTDWCTWDVQFGVIHYFLVSISCVAPDILSRFCFYSPDDRQKCFRIIKRIAPRESHSVKQRVRVYFADDGSQPSFGQFLTGLRVPAFRVMTTRTAVPASCQIDRIADTFSVNDCSGYVYKMFMIPYPCYTRSFSSARLAEFHELKSPVR